MWYFYQHVQLDHPDIETEEGDEETDLTEGDLESDGDVESDDDKEQDGDKESSTLERDVLEVGVVV